MKPRLELLVASFLAFGLQMLLVRAFHLFFAEIDAQALIPWSLSGFFLGGLWQIARTRKDSRDRTPYFLITALLLALLALSCLVVIDVRVTLPFVILVSAPPAALLVKAARRIPAHDFTLWDFAGGIAGNLVAYLLVAALGLETAFVFFIAAAFVAALFEHSGRPVARAGTGLALAAFVALAVDPLADLTSFGARYPNPEDTMPHRHAQLALRNREATRLKTRWSGGGKLDVLAFPSGERSDLFFYLNNADFFDLPAYPSRYPSRSLATGRSAYVIGAGGGGELRALAAFGYDRLTAAEVNPVIHRWMTEDFHGQTEEIFSKTRYLLAEGRNHLETHSETYDAIVINYIGNIGRMTNSGDDLSESFLFTRDAMSLYLDRLNEGGWFAIGQVYSPDLSVNPSALRLVETAADVLRERGLSPAENIWFFGQRRSSPAFAARAMRGMIFVTKGRPALPSEFFNLSESFQFYNAPVVTAPSDTVIPEGRGLYETVPQHESIRKAVVSPQIEDARMRWNRDVTPVTDDRPYFFQFETDAPFPTRAGAGLFHVALITTLILTATVLWRERREAEGFAGPAALLALASGTGFAYGLLEIALLTSLSLLFPSVEWNFFLMVFGLLLGSALAGLFGRSLGRGALVGFGALSVALLLATAAVPATRLLSIPADTGTRAVLAVLVTCVLTFGASLIYPRVLDAMNARRPRLTPFVPIFNTAFFILGSLSCRFFAISWGFRHTLTVTALLYAGLFVTVFVLRRRLAVSRSL